MSFSETDTLGGGAGGCLKSVLLSAIATATVTAILFADSEFGFTMIVFVVAFFVAMAVIGLSALVIGLPLTSLLESNGWERPWSYPVAGFVLGAIVVFMLMQAMEPSLTWSGEEASILLFGALPGFLCGASWWWFERRHRQGGQLGKASEAGD